ncbi:hypothetical protein R6Q59_023575 [Mikania micrantha]
MTEEPQTPQQGSDSHHENTSAMMAAYCVLRSRFCAGEEAPGFFSSSGNRRFSLARVVVHVASQPPGGAYTNLVNNDNRVLGNDHDTNLSPSVSSDLKSGHWLSKRVHVREPTQKTTTNDAIKNGYSGTTAYDIPSPLTFAKFLVWTPLKQHLSNTNVKCHYKKK